MNLREIGGDLGRWGDGGRWAKYFGQLRFTGSKCAGKKEPLLPSTFLAALSRAIRESQAHTYRERD